jgi:hypothetical protein
MKILIIGFGRSGTTLTYRTFRRHKQVQKAFLESCYVALYSKEKLMKKFPVFNEGFICAEKINYSGDRISKPKFVLEMTPHEYCQRWIQYFGDEARIVQVIRHPLDTLTSLIIKRGRKMKARKNLKEIEIEDIPLKIRDNLENDYFNAIPKYPQLIASLQQTITFKYEDLLLNTQPTLNKIFKFCGLDVGSCENLRKDRAFNYKKSKFQVDRPIENIINVFNSIAGGVLYEDI